MSIVVTTRNMMVYTGFCKSSKYKGEKQTIGIIVVNIELQLNAQFIDFAITG